ncbi:MAG: hypothetical protein ACLT1A_07590 [Dysosmobacter sp.]
MTFNESSYDQTNATGFINLWGLPDTVLALREQGSSERFREGAGSLQRRPPPVLRLVNAAQGGWGKVFSAGTRPAENVFNMPGGEMQDNYKTTGAGRRGFFALRLP